MVHRKYKWNISKEEGERIVYNQIEKILREKDNMTLEIKELIFILNNRTKHIDFLNNNKKKNIHNFIKNVLGGLINYIDQYDIFMIQKEDNQIFIRYNNLDLNEWILVTNNE
tara:strand:- start:6256 stop:6591 length:336 start_codon:yes stop_codon:yes gene_type:complete